MDAVSLWRWPNRQLFPQHHPLDIMSTVPAASKDSEMEVQPVHAEQALHQSEKFDPSPGDSDSVSHGNLVYTDDEEEPEIHLRTWLAYASMVVLIFVQSLSLQAPPSVVSTVEHHVFLKFSPKHRPGLINPPNTAVLHRP